MKHAVIKLKEQNTCQIALPSGEQLPGTWFRKLGFYLAVPGTALWAHEQTPWAPWSLL